MDDVVALIAVAHGRCLRELSAALGCHVNGLQFATRKLGRRLPARVARRLTQLDIAFGVTRHITQASCDELAVSLRAALLSEPVCKHGSGLSESEMPSSAPSSTRNADWPVPIHDDFVAYYIGPDSDTDSTAPAAPAHGGAEAGTQTDVSMREYAMVEVEASAEGFRLARGRGRLRRSGPRRRSRGPPARRVDLCCDPACPARAGVTKETEEAQDGVSLPPVFGQPSREVPPFVSPDFVAKLLDVAARLEERTAGLELCSHEALSARSTALAGLRSRLDRLEGGTPSRSAVPGAKASGGAAAARPADGAG